MTASPITPSVMAVARSSLFVATFTR
jgi:hypothetical protein